MSKPATTLEAAATGGYMNIGSAGDPLALTFVCGTGEAAYTCTYKATGTVKLDVQEEGAQAKFVPMSLTTGAWPNCSGQQPHLWVENNSDGNYISQFTTNGIVVCKITEEPCAAGNRYGAGTAVEASPSGKFILNNPIAKAECTSSSLVGQLTGTDTFELSSLSFSGCASSISLTVENLPYKGVIYRSVSPGQGRLFLENVKIKYYRFGVTCYYGALVVVQIGISGELTFPSLTILSGSSGLCGKVGSPTPVTGQYNITTPNPFYVSWY